MDHNKNKIVQERKKNIETFLTIFFYYLCKLLILLRFVTMIAETKGRHAG